MVWGQGRHGTLYEAHQGGCACFWCGRYGLESQTQISAQGAVAYNGRVEIQQEGTMAVVVPGITDESTEPSDTQMESASVDT
ncbi:hypothetical protein NDU88_006274 [Pleurodeles waltl]|uniref:Uncharacterized protein n=1 Tax=Pleurodeles waltl TaxID=8319 RepID=A0AAV7WDT2_PLEWA|nr:hypothetical protein NDU88_006274 [Pleurodeles waltl]